MKDYEQDFIDFWEEIVCNKDGSLNKDAVMKELFDYRNMIDEVSKTYWSITGGRLSKPNTKCCYIEEAVEDYYKLLYLGDGL